MDVSVNLIIGNFRVLKQKLSLLYIMLNFFSLVDFLTLTTLSRHLRIFNWFQLYRFQKHHFVFNRAVLFLQIETKIKQHCRIITLYIFIFLAPVKVQNLRAGPQLVCFSEILNLTIYVMFCYYKNNKTINKSLYTILIK